MTWKKLCLHAVLGLVGLVAFALPASATHFRGGSIQWTIPNPASAPSTVKFVVLQAWRADFTDCVELNFGDGMTSSNGCASSRVVSSKTDESGLNYKLFQYEVTHAYAPASRQYTVSFASCCRISSLINGADKNFRVEAKVVIGSGKRAGPESAMSSINVLEIGASRQFAFSMVDPDRDPVSCRLATDTEAGFANSVPSVGGKLPTVSSASSKCTVTWDLSAAVANSRFALTIVVESRRGGVVSSIATDAIVLTTAGQTYGACASSPVSTIERTSLLAGRTNFLQVIPAESAAYNITCRSGRYGSIRLPLTTVALSSRRKACAMVQTDCPASTTSRFCLTPSGPGSAVAGSPNIGDADLAAIESAASADLGTLTSVGKFNELANFICGAK